MEYISKCFFKGRVLGRRKDSPKRTVGTNWDKILQGQSREERNGLGFAFALDVVLTYLIL